MALATFAAASGAQSSTYYENYQRKLQRFRKKKKSVRCDPAMARPLFVAEAELKAKLFGHKDVVLVLFPNGVALLCGSGFDSEDETDEQVPVLKMLAYSEILDVLLTEDSLEIEHVDSADRPRLAIAQLVDLLKADPQASASSNSSQAAAATGKAATTAAELPPVPAGDDSVHSGNAGSSCSGTGGAAVTTMGTVTCLSTTLLFPSVAAAREAAAAILFYRAQSDALDVWLTQGLHAGFKCQLASVDALPLPQSSGASCATLWRAASFAVGRSSSCIMGGDSRGGRALVYAWAPDKKKLGWGSKVPLPQAWGALLDQEAAAGRTSEDGSSTEIAADDLNTPISLPCGPQVLLVTFSTPLGLAQATITPQIARAALLNSNCNQVLAVPVPEEGNSNHSRGATPLLPVVSFQLAFGSNGAVSPSASPGSAAATAAATAVTAAVGGGAVPSFGLEAYAALTVQLVRTPETAGKAAAVVPLDPYHAGNKSAGQQLAGQQRLNAAQGQPVPAQVPSAYSSSQQQQQQLLIRLSLLVVVGSLLVPQLGQQPLLVMLQLLLLLGVALLDYSTSSRGGQQPPAAAAAAASAATPAAHVAGGAGQQVATALQPSSGLPAGRSQRVPSTIRARGAVCTGKLSTASSAGSAFASAASSPFDLQEEQEQECPLSCGWSLVLVEGDVLVSPGPFLQLQVAQVSCSDESAELRTQMTCLELLQEEQLPCLVSQPEPAWMTQDIKQRFINAKPTLQESQLIALTTHEWRQAKAVDSVLRQPCPCFDRVQQVLPMYLLARSPEGHAVIVMKGRGIKELCDAIHRPPAGSRPVSTGDLEHYITLQNEYVVKQLAPDCLPGGCQVQVYDLAGLQMKHVMGEGVALFQVLLGLSQHYPERLHMAMIVNAPSWFSIPYKCVAQFLHPNTRARVVVVSNPRDALQQLSHHLHGIEHVPQEWGGSCRLQLHEYAAHAEFVRFVQRTNAAAAAAAAAATLSG